MLFSVVSIGKGIADLFEQPFSKKSKSVTLCNEALGDVVTTRPSKCAFVDWRDLVNNQNADLAGSVYKYCENESLT